MSFIADGHIHIYPSLDLERLILNAHKSLVEFGKADSYVLFSVEPSGQLEFFNIVKRLSASIAVSPTEDSNILKLSTPFGSNLYLVAGRQVVSKERLEFLVLFYNKDIKDGLTIDELVAATSKTSSLLVLNWAPGKWMFSRAKIVKDIFEKFSPKDLLICDTALRFLPEPTLMKEARKKGFKIIAGTDPFPLEAEEQRVGRYGFKCESNLNFKEALQQADLEVVGLRLSFYRAIKILWQWREKKKQIRSLADK